MLDDSLLDNQEILQLINVYRVQLNNGEEQVGKSFFIYHPDPKISTLAVSLLNFPYDESDRWRKEYSQSTGYQKKLFEQSYEGFIQSIAVGNEDKLMNYLKIGEDKTHLEVESVLSYLKLRKIKRMLHENQEDMEKAKTKEEFDVLYHTHAHLKQMEIAITGKLGSVIIR
jgi:DNA primase